MKMKLLSLVVLPFLTLSCNTRGGKGSKGVKFKDPNINAAINLSASKKDELRKEIHDYQVDSKMLMNEDASELSPSSYYEEVNKQPVDVSYFVSFDKEEMNLKTTDNYLIELEEGVKKEGNKYVGTGFLETLNGDEKNQDYFKRIYDFYFGDWIYSFGLIDSLRNLYSSDLNISMTDVIGAQANASLSISIDDSEWYEKIVCNESDGNGNLTIGLNAPIEFTEKMKSEVVIDGSTYTMTIDMQMKIDYIEGKYIDYRIDHEVVSMYCVVKMSDPLLVGEDVSFGVRGIELNTYSYNTGK